MKTIKDSKCSNDISNDLQKSPDLKDNKKNVKIGITIGTIIVIMAIVLVVVLFLNRNIEVDGKYTYAAFEITDMTSTTVFDKDKGTYEEYMNDMLMGKGSFTVKGNSLIIKSDEYDTEDEYIIYQNYLIYKDSNNSFDGKISGENFNATLTLSNDKASRSYKFSDDGRCKVTTDDGVIDATYKVDGAEIRVMNGNELVFPFVLYKKEIYTNYKYKAK